MKRSNDEIKVGVSIAGVLVLAFLAWGAYSYFVGESSGDISKRKAYKSCVTVCQANNKVVMNVLRDRGLVETNTADMLIEGIDMTCANDCNLYIIKGEEYERN